MTDTARLFDAMADEYEVFEPWYAHLYAVLHAIVRGALASATDGGRALDAGCGTGFQTALLADLGYRPHGLDVAARPLAHARRRLPRAAFALGTVEALPYPDACFDAVTCCGSTLSFVEAPARALRELSRVLRPGGRLLLECEHAWSLDLAWALLGGLTGDRLGYALSAGEAWRSVARRPSVGCVVRYPGYGRLRLFTTAELERMLGASGLAIERLWGIHMLTNLIPSTVLHRPRLSRPLAGLFRALGAVDAALRRLPGTHRIANSVVVLARKG